MKNTTRFIVAAGLLGLGLVSSAKADLFRFDVTVDNQNQVRTYKKAEDVIRAAESDELRRLFPTYSQTASVVDARIGFRGLPMQVSFPVSQSSRLVFNVPSIGLSREFIGANRDASIDMLVDFLESDGGDLLSRLQAELARVSPTDPVAGNPSSLQGMIISQDFAAAGFGLGNSSVGSAVATAQDRQNRMEIGIRAGTFTTGEFSGQSYTLPLSWTMRMDDPRYQLQIRLPLTYTTTEGAESYAANLGIGFQFPLSDNWYLTPQVSYGATGSIDQGSVGQLGAGTLTSRYEIDFDSAKLTIANMIGYMQAIPLSAGDFRYDPDLKNTITKNGLMVELPVGMELLGRGTSLQAAGAVTHLMGDDLYLNTYYDLSLTFGTRNSGSSSLIDMLRLGVAYTFGDDYNSVTASLGYQF